MALELLERLDAKGNAHVAALAGGVEDLAVVLVADRHLERQPDLRKARADLARGLEQPLLRADDATDRIVRADAVVADRHRGAASVGTLQQLERLLGVPAVR